jgi:hypothetical protein
LSIQNWKKLPMISISVSKVTFNGEIEVILGALHVVNKNWLPGLEMLHELTSRSGSVQLELGFTKFNSVNLDKKKIFKHFI